MTAERKSYYRSAWRTADGREGTFAFRADRLDLATNHAEQWARREGATVTDVWFAGHEQPTEDFGKFVEGGVK